jgi:hypothetical protein
MVSPVHIILVSMFMFLFLAIGIRLLSLSVLTIIMTNAQASSGSIYGSNSSNGNDTRVIQMGICVIGVSNPCNHNSNSDMPR